MSGKSHRWWRRTIIVTLIITLGTGGIIVWRSPQRAALITFITLVVAVCELVAPLVASLRRGPVDVKPDSHDMEQLADAVGKQWNLEAFKRQLADPIPVLWGIAPPRLFGSPSSAVSSKAFRPLPGMRAIAESDLIEGRIEDLHKVYGGLGSGRLLIIGEPGSGKSGAAIVLIRAALQHREERKSSKEKMLVPVPLLFTAHDWVPTRQSLVDWLARLMSQTYELFEGRQGVSRATALIELGKFHLF
jgi:hypothetical protein